MIIPSASSIAFAQAINADSVSEILKDIRKKSRGVDKIAMIRRVIVGDADTTVFTFWFKGHNGKQSIRYTYSMVTADEQ